MCLDFQEWSFAMFWGRWLTTVSFPKQSFLIIVTASLSALFEGGSPRGTRNHGFTQVFCTNHAQKLPEIYVHANFTQSRWMPDWFFTQSRNHFHPIHVFTLWNMSNNAISHSPWGAPWRLRLARYRFADQRRLNILVNVMLSFQRLTLYVVQLWSIRIGIFNSYISSVMIFW